MRQVMEIGDIGITQLLEIGDLDGAWLGAVQDYIGEIQAMGIGAVNERHPLIQAAYALEYLRNVPEATLVEMYKAGDITREQMLMGIAELAGDDVYELGKKRRKRKGWFRKIGRGFKKITKPVLRGLKKVVSIAAKPLQKLGPAGAAIAGMVPGVGPAAAGIMSGLSAVEQQENAAYVGAAAKYDPSLTPVFQAMLAAIGLSQQQLQPQIESKQQEISALGYDKFKGLMTDVAANNAALAEGGLANPLFAQGADKLPADARKEAIDNVKGISDTVGAAMGQEVEEKKPSVSIGTYMAIGAGALALIGGGIYLATRK